RRNNWVEGRRYADRGDTFPFATVYLSVEPRRHAAARAPAGPRRGAAASGEGAGAGSDGRG
ncbi:hypothetical protein ACWEQ3_38745, partial [Streptomyces mirabilis]